MKYIDAERITAEIDKIIDGLKKKSNPNPLGTIDDMLADAEIETLELVKTIIDEERRKKTFIEKACTAYCKVCDTQECECTFECGWVKKFEKQLKKEL